jgi:hypothetical protein
MTPREWQNDDQNKPVKWTDYKGPTRADSFFFVFPHVFNIEYGGQFDVSNYEFELSDARGNQARQFFSSTPHSVHVIESSVLGPIVIAHENHIILPKGIVFHKFGIEFVTVPEKIVASHKSRVPHLAYALSVVVNKYAKTEKQKRSNSMGKLPALMFRAVPQNDFVFQERLENVLDEIFPAFFKVGVLYMPPGTSYQDELLGVDQVSDHFVSFLKLITDDGSASSGRYVSKYKQSQLVFHVAPMIRSSPEKFIQRDSVVIVFKEGKDDVFVPTSKVSHETQVYIMVSLDSSDIYKKKYQIQVAAKLKVPPFPPYLPEPAIFTHSLTLREFMLHKIVNAHRAALAVNPERSVSISGHLNDACRPYVFTGHI